VYLIEEGNRPGEYMPILEDEHGTYIMNSKDLRAVHYVDRLAKMGIDCLKIEGRTKSHYYVARTAQIYRQAIDDALADKPFNPALYKQLEGLANRGYTDGFYQRHPDQAYQNYLNNYSDKGAQRFVGEILGFDQATGMAEVAVKNRFAAGDQLEVILPTGNYQVEVNRIESDQGESLDCAPGSGYVVRIPLPLNVNVTNGLLAKNL
jgi:putative protease